MKKEDDDLCFRNYKNFVCSMIGVLMNNLNQQLFTIKEIEGDIEFLIDRSDFKGMYPFSREQIGNILKERGFYQYRTNKQRYWTHPSFRRDNNG